MKKGCFLLIIICLFTLHACSSHKQNKTIAIDYYYWKKNFELDSFQKKIMLSTHSSHNYLRIFDVVWSEKRRMAVPVAVMKSKNELNENWQPAIYITNESLIQTPTLQIDSLAEKIVRLTNQMVFEKKMDTTELQLDCDWTVATKEKYFHLVNEIKKLTNKKISATIPV